MIEVEHACVWEKEGISSCCLHSRVLSELHTICETQEKYLHLVRSKMRPASLFVLLYSLVVSVGRFGRLSRVRVKRFSQDIGVLFAVPPSQGERIIRSMKTIYGENFRTQSRRRTARVWRLRSTWRSKWTTKQHSSKH